MSLPLPALAVDDAVLEVGSLRLEYASQPVGMRVWFDGIAVISSSELIVTTPAWSPDYYVGPSADAVVVAARTIASDAATLTITHRDADDAFVATETITVGADDTIVQTLEARFNGPADSALMQWRIAALNPSILVGRDLTIIDAGGALTKRVFPVAPQAVDPPLARGFAEVRSITRAGLLFIHVDSPSPLTLCDYRASHWADTRSPCFWFGDMGTTLERGVTVRYHIRYEFHKMARRMARQSEKRSTIATHACNDALIPARAVAPRVIPTPKELERLPGTVVFSALPDSLLVGPDAKQPWSDAHLELRRCWTSLLADSGGETTTVLLRFADAGSDWIPPAEGYELVVEPSGIAITAADATGFLNAVQTLKQLSWLDADGRMHVHCVRIRDWPALPFRGIHLFTGGHGTDLHERLIRDVIAATKFNHLVIESEYIAWDAFPELHHSRFGMSKDEVRTILRTCRDLGVEVIPLIQTLGHCDWIFASGQHLNLAEDPDARWAYCVTNPATYDLIFKVYAEALELFKPRTMHIGHDEYADRGRVPYRESSKPYSVEQLFMMDTLKLHAWLRERGVGVMMWGDMLLAQGEAADACHAKSPAAAAELRAELPDDVVVADWHYEVVPPERYTSLDVLQRDGNATLAATWFREGNIINFARAAHQAKARGLLQTTWAGFSLDPESFARELHQYYAYVLAAEAAWNADRAIDMDLLDAADAFFEMMGMSALPNAPRKGWAADLTSAVNLSLTAREPGNWFGLGPEHDLSAVPVGKTTRWRGMQVQVADRDGCNAVAIAGKLAPQRLTLPSVVTLSIDQPADTLILVTTTDFPCEQGTPVVSAEVRFSDDTTEQIDLVYGENVFAHTDLTPSANAPAIWRGITRAGTPVVLRATVWNLNTREQRIKSMTLRSANAPASLVLVALSGLVD
ncbi:MAG: beta-N-acetylhexosaminidase [Phycisphaerales bacterium]|nr:beta-N-acetylhexosaminidase [Phycisphaerales bacterium]